MCALTLCGECVAELTLVGEAGGGNRSGGQPLRKQKTKRFCSHCPLSAMLDAPPVRAQAAAESDSQKSVTWQLSAPRSPALHSHLTFQFAPPPHLAPHVCALGFLVGFQLLRVIKSDVLPLSDMSCKSTPIESHHFVTVCPVNRIFFVWTSVLWLCSWEPFWCPSPTGQRYAVICDCTGMNMRGWLSVSLCPVTDWWSV